MKIDNSLRAAIRSFCKPCNRPDRDRRAAALRQAAEQFIGRSPKTWERRLKAHQKAVEAATKADARVKALSEPFKNAGFSTWNLPRIEISDTEAFVKAGGKLPTLTVARDPDTIIAKLAAATPPEGATILRELGINWA